MNRPKQFSPAHLAWICTAWNQLYPVGTWVQYHPVIGKTEYRLRRTCSGASILSDHTAVIFLDGESGCVALEACVPVPAKEKP